MISITYGTQEHSVDVTLLAKNRFFSKINEISIPSAVSFNEIFTDVVPGEKKYLVIKCNGLNISLEETDRKDFLFQIPDTKLPFFEKRATICKEECQQKKYFLTFGDAKYSRSVNRICREAFESNFFDVVTGLNHQNLSQNFVEKYSHVMNRARGGGYWIWKPHIIQRQLANMNENDLLVYCDAGCTVNKNGEQKFLQLVDKVNFSGYGIVGYDLMVHPEYKWTNERVFQHFKVAIDDDSIRKTSQIMASIIVMKKCPHSVMLIDKWCATMDEDALLFTDEYNKETENREFVDHRHDQSVFSVIRKQYGCILLPDDTFARDWSILHEIGRAHV